MIGSGKNSAADEFIKLGFEKDSFAASLKDACSVIFGWDRELLEGITDESRTFRETPDIFWTNKLRDGKGKFSHSLAFTPRLALQWIGTDVMRDHFHQDIWINSMEYRLQKDPNKNIVISDCRFKNEINLIKHLGGKLIQVNRGKKPTWYNTAIDAHHNDPSAIEFMKKFTDVHQSEWDWIGADVDYVINNDSSFEDLQLRVREIHQALT